MYYIRNNQHDSYACTISFERKAKTEKKNVIWTYQKIQNTKEYESIIRRTMFKSNSCRYTYLNIKSKHCNRVKKE